VAIGPYGGVAAGHYRGGVAVGPAGAGVAARSTHFVSPNYLATRGVAVRGGYAYHRAYFTPNWYVGHPGAWRAARWTTAGLWAAATWPLASGYCGIVGVPISYDYGTTVVYEGDTVYINGEAAASANQYAAAATAIADQGRAARPDEGQEWQSLGVYGLVQGEETIANNIFQLAVDKAGVIRGNYYDALADNNLPVLGSVDKATQRAAWSVGEKKEIVYEAGLYNLTQPQCPVLIHYGKERTQQMILVRLEQPAN
jgi:hypothetical protein